MRESSTALTLRDLIFLLCTTIGEPTIRGMRITVSHVFEMLAGGRTPDQVLQDFPYLEKADIEASP